MSASRRPAISERYLRSGDSELAPAEKPFAINPALAGRYGPLDSRARLARSPFVRAIPDRGNEAIQFGSAAYHPAMGDRVGSREYAATGGFWPGHRWRNSGLSGEAALIRISPDFRLTRKGQSIMIRRQE